MDTQDIVNKLEEITRLLELSCRQQREILERLDGMEYGAQPALPDAAEAEELTEIEEFEEFDQRPEDMLTCPRCHIMQSASHDACSHCGVGFRFRSEQKE